MPYAYQVRDRKRVKRGVLTGLLLLCLALLLLLIPFGTLGWSRQQPEGDRKSEESKATEPSAVRVGAGRASAYTSTGGSLGLASGTPQWVDPVAACGDCAGHGIPMSTSSAALLSELEGAQHPAGRQLASMMRQMTGGGGTFSPQSAGNHAGSAGAGGSGGGGGYGGVSSESSEETAAQPLIDLVLGTTEPPADLSPGESPVRGFNPPGGSRRDDDGSDDDVPADDRRGGPRAGDDPIGLVPPAPSGPGSDPSFDPPAPGVPDREKIIKELLDDPTAERPAAPSDPLDQPPSTGPSADDPPADAIPEPSPMALYGVALFVAAAYRFRHILVR